MRVSCAIDECELIIVDPLSSQGGKSETRRIPVPPHRYTPLKENWMKIFTPIVEQLKLQIRFNLNARKVEIRVRLYISIVSHNSRPNCLTLESLKMNKRELVGRFSCQSGPIKSYGI